MAATIILDTFRGFDCSFVRMPMFTVYNCPSDFPHRFVARLFDIEQVTPYLVVGATEQEVIEKLPMGLHRFGRSEGDLEAVVCTYL